LRGKRNEPSYVRLVYERAAEIRGVPLERLAAAVFKNAALLFGWGDSAAEVGA
jgi:TatD DNase family protein